MLQGNRLDNTSKILCFFIYYSFSGYLFDDFDKTFAARNTTFDNASLFSIDDSTLSFLVKLTFRTSFVNDTFCTFASISEFFLKVDKFTFEANSFDFRHGSLNIKRNVLIILNWKILNGKSN